MTNAVVASCPVELPGAAVGADGAPLKAGEASGAPPAPVMSASTASPRRCAIERRNQRGSASKALRSATVAIGTQLIVPQVALNSATFAFCAHNRLNAAVGKLRAAGADRLQPQFAARSSCRRPGKRGRDESLRADRGVGAAEAAELDQQRARRRRIAGR